jgi:hypothetical protein
MEKTIADQNGKLVRALQGMFKPVAAKTQIGFHISIQDKKVELSTMLLWKGRKSSIESRVVVSLWDINSWFKSAKELRSQIRDVEKNLRALKTLTREGHDKGKITLTPPNNITVGIDTRDRYF